MPPLSNRKISLTLEVSDERVACLLTSAFEGGSNYWYHIDAFHAPPDGKLERHLDADTTFHHVDFPMSDGGALTIADMEDDDKNYLLNRTAIEKGLLTMAVKEPRHFADFMRENDDAITGDVFLQCCLFGEAKYG